MKKNKIVKGLALLFAAGAVVGMTGCKKKNTTKPDDNQQTGTDTPGTDTPGTDTPGTDTPGTDTPGTDTPVTPVVTPVADGKIEMNGQEYATLTAALAAISATSTDTYVIRLGKGTYNENGLNYKGSANIKISGYTTTEHGSDVIIKGLGKDQLSNKTRPLLEIEGSGNVVLENITLQNIYKRKGESGEKSQAEAFGFDSTGTAAAYNCSFLSHQDTIRTVGKAWFYDCYIEGDVDFLWCEASSVVALYENCKIKVVSDDTNAAYITAPKYSNADIVGKGLVLYKSQIEIEEKTGFSVFLFRNPWYDASKPTATDTLNSVAYVDTTVTGTLTDLAKSPAYSASDKLGYQIDAELATALSGTENTNNVRTMSADLKAKEYTGRRNIINRTYTHSKDEFGIDLFNYWDVDKLIADNNWTVVEDTSKTTLEGEPVLKATTYALDGSEELTDLTLNGFEKESGKTHFKGAAGSTITIPVTKKSRVIVEGYYSGIVEVTADSMTTKGIMSYNNGNTNNKLQGTFVVENDDVTNVTITAKSQTYLTKIIVVNDSSIEAEKVTSIEITKSNNKQETVGVSLVLSANVTPATATNKSVLWSSSDTTIGEIDQYTGAIRFKKAGDVTFTATACDGSNVVQTITCSPVAAKWVEAEWYTTDKVTEEETGATNISVFSPTAYKATTSFTFKNLDGKSITTSNGLKLNSAGHLKFSTTKPATLTLIVKNTIQNGADKFEAPHINGTDMKPTVTYLDDNKEYKMCVYTLAQPGDFDVTRAGGSEEDPIMYAKVEYEKTYIDSLNYVFKNLTDKPADGNPVDSTDEITINNCVAHGGKYVALKENNKLSMYLKAGAKLTLEMAYTQGTVKINNEEFTGNNTEPQVFTYVATADEKVVITGQSGKAYILSIKVEREKTIEELRAEACTTLETAYPAANYTNNDAYATVLAAQKALINAATKETLETVSAAAATEMAKLKTNAQIAAETIVSIAVTNTPDEVAKDSTPEFSIVVTATYADEHTATLTAEDYTISTIDTTVVAEDVEVTVTVNDTEISTTFTVNVVETVTTYTITYHTTVGTAPEAAEGIALPAELPALSDDGNKFLGWYFDEDCTEANKATASAVISADADLYAKWISFADLKVAIETELANYDADNYTEYATDFTTEYGVVTTALDAATTVADLDAIDLTNLAGLPTEAEITAAKTIYSFVYATPAKGETMSNDLYEGLTIEGTIKNNNNSIQASGNVTFRFTLDQASKVTINGFSGYSEYTIGGRTAIDKYSRTFEAGEVELVLLNTKYIVSIEISPLSKPIAEATVSSIVASGAKTEFTVGEEFATGSLKVKAIYSDGSYVNAVDMDDVTVDSSKVVTSAADTYEITVSYGGTQTTYNVEYTAPSTETAITKTVTYDLTNDDGKTALDANTKITTSGISRNGDNCAFVGTIEFDVKAGAVIMVAPYKTYGNYTLGLKDAEDLTPQTGATTFTAAEDCTVVITGLSGNYISGFAVVYPSTTGVKYVLRTDNTDDSYTSITSTAEKKAIVEDGIMLDGLNNGKIAPRNQQWAQFNANSEITVVVGAGQKLTVNVNSTDYTVTGVESVTGKVTSKVYETQTIVKIKATASTYIDYILIENVE